MNFPHIVALLDQYLARLQRARDVLATLHPMPAATTRKRSLRRPKRSKVFSPANDLDQTGKAPAPTPKTVIVRPARHIRRAERRPRSVAPATTPPGPFGPPSHTGPVFVRAELLPSRSRSGHPATGGAGQEREMPPALTAEALAKRWLSTSSVQ